MSRSSLQSVRECLAHAAGLQPPDWVLHARILERVEALGLDDESAYPEALRAEDELRTLVELLRVSETRFFRHRSQISALQDRVIPELRRGTGKLRAWSAGCATGEEAYTLAMLLTSNLATSGRPIEILASDISAVAIQHAETAEYSQQSIERVPGRLRQEAFEPRGPQRYRVRPHLRQVVQFEVRNLASRQYPRGFDLIWCRNVLIYFTPEARARALQELVSSLRAGGFLFLGYSESLRDVPGLRAIGDGDNIVYQRVEQRSVPTIPPSMVSAPVALSAVRTPARVAPPVPIRSQPTQPAPMPDQERARPAEVAIALSGSYEDSERLSREISSALDDQPSRVTIDLDGAEFLGNEAAAVLKRALATAKTLQIDLELRAQAPGPLRFLRRHDLLGGKAP